MASMALVLMSLGTLGARLVIYCGSRPPSFPRLLGTANNQVHTQM